MLCNLKTNTDGLFLLVITKSTNKLKIEEEGGRRNQLWEKMENRKVTEPNRKKRLKREGKCLNKIVKHI